MKKLLIETTVEGVESYLHTRLDRDRDSLKELCLTCHVRYFDHINAHTWTHTLTSPPSQDPA